MIRKLMASTAVLALISAGALTATAAETQKPAVQQDMTAAPSADTAAGVLTPDQPTLASVFIGRSVYSSADPESDNIGDVNDLIVAEDGRITDAVIGVGGFLGIGEKNVAVPFDKLEVVEKDGDIKLIYSATREELEAAPALDRTAYDPIARYSQEQAAKLSTDTGLAPPLAPATTASTDLPAPDPMAPADQQTAAVPVPSEETPAADITSEQTAAADTSSTGEVVTPPTVPATTADATVPMEANQVASSGGEFLTFGPHQVRASTLIGMTVYGAADENVGEVSDIVLQSDGQTRAALIDVGGFLGIGEKTVAVPFTDLHFTEVQDGAATDGTPVGQIKLSMSKDQLDQLPAYEAPAQQAAAPADAMVPADQTAANAPAASTTETAPDSEMAAAPLADTTSADQNIVTGSVATDYQPAGQELKASELMGLAVYGPDDVTVGEIGDVVFDENGSIQAIVVDAGGFLGIAEKPVAINFQDLKVRRDENGSLIAMVDKTKEQFDAAPAFQVTGTTDAGTTVQ